jgi:hypothetical protein
MSRSTGPCQETHTAEPFLPGERLTIGDAVAAYTIGSACLHHVHEGDGNPSVITNG